MISSKVDGRTARVTIGRKSDKLEVTTEKTPASALTDRGRDRLTEGVDMSTISRREISLEYLAKVADDLTKAASLRMQYILNARQYGATNQQIGDALGITESAVRRIITRHGDA